MCQSSWCAFRGSNRAIAFAERPCNKKRQRERLRTARGLGSSVEGHCMQAWQPSPSRGTPSRAGLAFHIFNSDLESSVEIFAGKSTPGTFTSARSSGPLVVTQGPSCYNTEHAL